MSRARIIGGTGIAVGVTVLAVLIGYLGGSLGTAPDQRIAAAEDTYANTADPHHVGGERAELVAGGMGGGAAVTYLKFTVSGLRGGRPPARAEVRLSRLAGKLPARLELTHVPATGWREASLNARSAPLLGTVVASAHPRVYDDSVVFDVSRVIRRAGTYSFAVTTPAGDGYATFWAKDGAPPIDKLVKPTLWLSWMGRLVRTPLPSSPALSGSPSSASPSSASPSSASPSPSSASPSASAAESPSSSAAPAESPSESPSGSPSGSPSESPAESPSGSPAESPSGAPAESPSGSVAPTPGPTDNPDPECVTGDRLVPTCGVLWGVAPGAHTDTPRDQALADFEKKTGRRQAVYHAYHRGTEIFPTAKELQIARERILFLNWKPTGATWAEIAKGHAATEAYLDRLADHLKATVTAPFFFAVHHEPENDVDPRAGSGYTAEDYRAMVRHALLGLRERGVTTIVSVMVYMAYVPLNTQPWFESLYPGDDVIDWVGWDVYAYSEQGGYGHGDFAEMMNRRSDSRPAWPGFYNWAAERHPSKPLMVGEWGVWHAPSNPGHMAYFYGSVGRQMPLFPRVKAMVYFDTPHDQKGRDSRVDSTPEGLAAYRELGLDRTFQVRVTPAGGVAPPSRSP